MKTAKVPPAEASSSSSRRSQPVRQTRTNPPRAIAGSSRGGRDSLSGANAAEQPINIYPGITHFADAITALPKELVRHFTLLKEVDAKIFAPEASLFQLIDLALVDPSPPPTEPDPSLNNDAASNTASSSTGVVATASSSNPQSDQAAVNGHAPSQPSTEVPRTNVFHPLNLPRRQLFRQTAIKIQEMLVSLEEKNHVISTANDALQKQLGRIDEIWPHLENEFSDEAKWGSDTHWAYPENRAARAANTQAEKTRREGAANLSAAALIIAEEAAARSDARKQAVAAKKSQKNQHHQDSEHDDHDGKGKEGTGKKAATKRKNAAAAAPTDSPVSVGLGITSQAGTNNTPAPKRRKVEKPANGGANADRAMSAAVSNAKESKAKASASPRATPAPDQPAPKKRKALPNSNGQGKKRAAAANSPSIVSSPVITNFPDTIKAPRASPAPSAARPASARARQNSTASTADNGRQRPASAASNKVNGGVPAPIEIPQNNGGRGPSETPKITQMEPPSATLKNDSTKLQNDRAPTPASATAAGQKKDGPARSTDESDSRKEPTPSSSAPAVQQVTTTKSGRASKPSTPAIGTFPDGVPSNNGRARPSRASEAPAIPKRSHKKGASAAHAAAVQKALTQQQKGSGGDQASLQEEDMDVDDPNEERYCYCNRVSFGEMVGCDGDKCKIEWFHLECVGLRSAPPKNMKWYCDECKKHNGKKVNGR